MSRSGRLLDLVQCLRRRRTPTTAAELAGELEVSLRTVYRDVAVLVARGVPIRGEAGMGYVLEAGHFLPPLSFTEDELDAVMLGLRWVEKRADADLARAAQDALAKIAAVLPAAGREVTEAPGIFVGPDLPQPVPAQDIALFRTAVRRRLKVHIVYRDVQGAGSRRVVWPIGLAFMEESRLLIAWCELRGAFRHFRLDRIAAAELGAPFPERRAQLLRRWRDQLDAETRDAAMGCQQAAL